MPTGSIIIPTLNRSECLRDCLESLWAQTNQDFEIIKVTEEGPLAKLRNQGAARSRGKILVFIDDDVICSPKWFESILAAFDSSETISGVSGPSFISGKFRRNRAIFRYSALKWIYDQIFLGSQARLPGHITQAGAWTTGACDKSCDYNGAVEFLEACNMSFRADVFRHFDGFDEYFQGIGDWSEPDLCFRMREYGHRLWFSKDVVLEHRPSKSGAFSKRKDQGLIRFKNYELFSERWVHPCWQHSLYKLVLKGYLGCL